MNQINIKKSGEVFEIIGRGHMANRSDALYGTESTIEEAIHKAKDRITSFNYVVVGESLIDGDHVIYYDTVKVPGAGKPSYGHEGFEAINKKFNKNNGK